MPSAAKTDFGRLEDACTVPLRVGSERADGVGLAVALRLEVRLDRHDGHLGVDNRNHRSV